MVASSSATSLVNTNSSSHGPVEDKVVVCYRCDVEGHNSKECSLKVCCLYVRKKPILPEGVFGRINLSELCRLLAWLILT
jgi:hypothetical protein